MKKLLLLIVSALLLSGCATTPTANSLFSAEDLKFAEEMIPHHEQAIEMADIALDPLVGASDAVKSLATRIKAAQDPEISKMKAFLTSWKERLTPDSSMDHGDMMDGMLSADDIKKLSSLRSAEFDREWMNGMIEHHEGAIEMAKDVLKDGKDSAVKALANLVATAQDSEILEMKKLLG